MKLELAEKIKKAADVLGIYAEIRNDYSGRGMFG
jgi:hypothetical protein